MNTKNNQRFHDTDVRMKSAMLEMMENTPFERITVKEICEKAGVNRGTFYSHYTDIYNMIESIEDHLSCGLNDIIKEWHTNSENQKKSSEFFTLMLKYIKDHKYFYRIALINRGSIPIKKSFRLLWEQFVQVAKKQTNVEEDELIYFFIYFQAGVTMVIKQWLETECEKNEKDMALILEQCIPIEIFEKIKNSI